MQRLLPLLSVLLWCACQAPARAPRPDPGASAAALALFDGVSLAGWQGDARFWRVEDGTIVGESTAEVPCTETTYLVWHGGEVEDFELELAWRFAAEGANSGVQFRSRAPGPTGVEGYQADLESGPDWTGGLYEQGGRGVVTRRGERVVLGRDGERTVEAFADGAALLARVAPRGWNRLRVTAFGPRLTIEVNGALFSETIDLDPGRAARRGALALQLHAGAPMRVEFRDLRLRRLGGPAALAAVPSGDAAGGGIEAEQRPQWIWPHADAAPGERAWFRRRFTLEAAPARATLWISGDNHCDAWLGGAGVSSSDDWTHPERVDVGAALVEGENELLVHVENEAGPAALALRLEVELADGRSFRLVSDDSFEAAPEPGAALQGDRLARWLADEAEWRRPHALGALGVPPWGFLDGRPAIGVTGVAPEPATIRVPPGFEVERLWSVPGDSQGSWVALAVDPRGRLYASDQYGGLYRVTLPGEGQEVRVERVPVALGEAQGLVWAFDALYVVVNGAGEYASGLWRARDTDGDDVLDEVTRLRAFDGDGEHGPHGIVLAPDGRSLLVIGGNHTKLPGPFARTRVPPVWAEDALLAPLPDPNGHAVGIAAPGGWVARTDPEGEAWELVAVGFRNAYDLAFDGEGELYTYDADMEWDLGLPWYRPTRILHVVSGADYGWRTGSGKWPADVPDSLPADVDLGLASPTGLVSGTATRFPAPWNRALFACDWAYGRVHAVFPAREESGEVGRHELFLEGRPFPVTDAVVGLDGALYLTIGGRRVQSGLYRVRWSGAADAVAAVPAVEPEARARRRALEELHGVAPADPAAAAALALGELGAREPLVRHAARVALEHLDPRLWRAAVERETDPVAALAGWIARVRCDPEADAAACLVHALPWLAEDAAPATRLDAARLLELVLLRLAPDDATRARMRAALDPLYPSGDARLDRTLLGLLVALRAEVAGRALAVWERSETQEGRIAVLHALRALGGPWSAVDGARVLAAFELEIERAEGGASVRGYLESMRDEARAHIGPLAMEAEARRAQAVPGVAARAAPARSGRAWTLAELEPRLAELASGRDPARGRAVYEGASCSSCHRFAGAGASQGPDLTGAGGRYAPRDFLLAVLEPSREVPDVWRDTEFRDDERLLAVGRLEGEDDQEVRVRTTAGESLRLVREHVTERRLHPLSRMPEGLLDGFEAEEILDLCAYVLAGSAGDAAER